MGFLFKQNFGTCDSCPKNNIMINVLYIEKDGISTEIDLCNDCLKELAKTIGEEGELYG